METCLSRWTAGSRQKTLKIKTFHTTKCRDYPHEKLNSSEGVIRNRCLALAREEEIASAQGNQLVTSIRRISIRKDEGRIQTNTYILIFNHPRTPKEMKISYCLESVLLYIPVPMRCFKCQKYGHHREPVDDDRQGPNAVKRTRTTWRKIAWKKLHVQTADKIIRHTQDLAMFTKRKWSN